jgi:hypothetical protein
MAPCLRGRASFRQRMADRSAGGRIATAQRARTRWSRYNNATKTEDSGMKKVWYVVGAVGAAPTLGILAPAATAAATPHSVSGTNLRCTDLYANQTHVGTGANKFTGGIYFGRTGDVHCLFEMVGILNHSQSGLEMRARAYWNGSKIYSQYVHGTINPALSITSFYIEGINRNASNACEALVYSTKPSKVAYGPVCEPVSVN